MKRIILTFGLLVALTLTASATVVLDWHSGTLNSAIADNSAAGAAFTTAGGSWSGAWAGGNSLDTTSGSLSVLLNISGGYNNDLYGYLVYNDGAGTMTQVLLNRVTSTGAGLGSGAGTSSFAELQSAGVTLIDTAGSGIHSATGNPVTGSFTADSGATLNGTFGNMASGGTWTLFLADLAAGDQSTLVSWGLSVSVVPEPATWALLSFGGLVGLTGLARFWRRRTV